MIIGLNGYAGAGKDECARALAMDGYTRVSFADPVREAALAINPIIRAGVAYVYTRRDGEELYFVARTLKEPLSWLAKYRLVHIRLRDAVNTFGWDEAKKIPEVRQLLQRIGTEGGRDIHGQGCWVDLAAKKVVSLLFQGKKVVVTDVRFPEEVGMIRDLDGFIVGVEREGVGPVNGHKSDNLTIRRDLTIRNDDGIATLHRRIREVAKSLEEIAYAGKHQDRQAETDEPRADAPDVVAGSAEDTPQACCRESAGACHNGG